MPSNKKAILPAAELVKEKLSSANAARLNQVLGLIDDEGRVNLATVLQALYPGMYNPKKPKARTPALAALRKFRETVAIAAEEAGAGFRLESDGQTRSEPHLRSLWFKIDGRATVGLEETAREAAEQRSDSRAVRALSDATGAEIADVAAGIVPPTGRPYNETRPLIRCFLAYAQPDRPLKNRLMKYLLPRLSAHPRARIEISASVEIKPKRRSRDSASEDLKRCDFCLLLVSPSLFANSFISDQMLPRLLAEKRGLVVCLAPSEGLDTLGLDPSGFFHGVEGKAFSQQNGREEQEAFAVALFHKIDELLEKPVPAAERLHDAALDAAIDRELKAFLSSRGRPLGEMDKKAIPSGGSLASIQDTPGYREDALEFLLRWLRDEKASPWCALLGEYGMGKTTTCKALARKMMELRDGGETLPLPVYLDLRPVGKAARSDLVLEGILGIILAQSWKAGPGRARPTPGELIAQVRNEGALIIWDGLDEVLVHLDTHAGQQFTRQLYSILPPRADAAPSPSRLLISCRTHFFRTLREQQTHFLGEGRENIRGYSAFLLLPFDEGQIRQYVEQTLPGHDPDRVMETIGAVHNLRELAERPYTLSLIASEFAGIERWKAEGRRVTGVTLYRHMVLSWLERDTGKHHFTPDHKQALMEHVAAELWRSGARYWSIGDLEQWLIGFMAARPELAAHYPDKTPELLKEDLRTATFLVRDDEAGGDGKFRFAHTSLQEYFLAGYLRRALLESQQRLWDLPRPSPETIDFLGQWLLEDETELPQKQRDVALGSLRYLRDVYCRNASELAFAYYLLAKRKGYPAPSPAGFQLPGANLAEWEITGTAGAPLLLARANFREALVRNTQWKHCNLEGADFSGANADRAEWLSCYLARSSWRAASLEATLFRDCRMTRAVFDDSRCNRTRFLRCDPTGATGLPSGRPDAYVVAPGGTRCDASEGTRVAVAGGHSDWVRACAWSPDGTHILSASGDQTLRIWDAASGDSLLTLQGHSGYVTGCAWSPDGTRILSASGDKTLRIWDAASGDSPLTLQGHSWSVFGCAWSPDGTRILSASGDKTLRIWDAATGDSLLTLQGHSESVFGCAWSPDGGRILSASGDNTLRIWDAATGDRLLTLQGHSRSVSGCAWSPDGTRILSTSWDKTLRIWDAASGDRLLTLQGHSGDVNGCAWSPDGTRILSASGDQTLRIWDAATGDSLLTLQGHSEYVNGCAWSPDGTRILSASWDNTLRIWDAATGDRLLTLQGHLASVSGCAWSPDGTRILSASGDETLRIWDAASGDRLLTLQGHSESVTGCAWSPEGTRILSASDDNTLRIWDAATGDTLLTLQGHSDSVYGCAWSPDGTRILSTSWDKTLRIWDAASGDSLLTLQGHLASVSGCAWSPDGTRILSASADKTLRIWDAASGDSLLTLQGHLASVSGCAWSPDGTRILSVSWDKTLRIWDAATGDRLLTLQGHSGYVSGCAWSPDGTRILSASWDNTLRIWDAASGDRLLTLQGHSGYVSGCAWSPDGMRIISASGDGTLRIWEAASGRELGPTCYHLYHPRSEAADWATLDLQHSRILHCSSEAWRSLGWVTPGSATRPPEWLPAETFGPLPTKE